MLSDHLLGYVSQYALIKNKRGAVLLIQRKDMGVWGLPGGRIEEPEDWFSSLQREVKEEANLDVVSAIPVAVNIVRTDEFAKYCAYFKVKLKKLTCIRADDSKKRRIAWVSEDKIKKLKFHSLDIKKIVLDFLSH